MDLERRSEFMHENTTDTIKSKWIINITYGVNNQHKEFYPKLSEVYWLLLNVGKGVLISMNHYKKYNEDKNGVPESY